jgi:hypothetical protein
MYLGHLKLLTVSELESYSLKFNARLAQSYWRGIEVQNDPVGEFKA